MQPERPHAHWHIDISYVSVRGTFCYLCSVLDGCSRFVVYWELREAMREVDVEIVLERAREKVPDAGPRVHERSRTAVRGSSRETFAHSSGCVG